MFQKRGRLRPSSAPTYSRGGVGVGGKENAVLYKIFVTTADKKAAGTDAKVRKLSIVFIFYLSILNQGKFQITMPMLTYFR